MSSHLKSFNSVSKVDSFSESGRGELIALISTAAFIYALRGTSENPIFLGYVSNPVIYTFVLVMLGLSAVFSLGYTLHYRLIGGVSTRKLNHELKQRIKELESIIKYFRDQIAEVEAQLLDNKGIASRKTIDCLGLSRRIVIALEKRLLETQEIVKFDTEINLIQAYDLLTQVLQISDNCLDSLIDSEPVPPLKPYEWEPTLQRLMEQIHSELNNRKVAQTRA